MRVSVYLQAGVDFGGGAGGFDVEDDVGGFKDGCDVQVGEFAVGYGGDGGIEFFVGREFVDHFKSVFVTHGCGVGPGVVDGDVEVVFLQCFDYINHLGVAHVGAVFLEGESEDNDVAAEYLDAFFEHELDDAISNVGTHSIVHAASGKDDFGIVTVALCTLSEVVWIDSNAVTANEAGLEWEEVPFG